MNFDEYQAAAGKTAIYPEAGAGNFNALSYTVLGLSSEVGELSGKLKKIWRDSGGVITDQHASALASELSDCLWYIAATLSELRYSMDEVAEYNITKLQSRQERGVLGGSGDNR